jgi:hypothetical protein
MARGWESKDVESQQELRAEERRAAAVKRPSPESVELARKIESLELTRSRILADLERARHPRHQQQLRSALDYIEGEIAQLARSDR